MSTNHHTGTRSVHGWNHNYRKGRAREYGAIRRLKNRGALWVVRSYGSHGLFDITAVFQTHTLLIQVKKDRIGKEEMGRLKKFAANLDTHADIFVQVWIYKDRKLHVTELAPGQTTTWFVYLLFQRISHVVVSVLESSVDSHISHRLLSQHYNSGMSSHGMVVAHVEL